MIVKLLTELHLEFLSFKGGCKGSSEYTLVKTSNFWGPNKCNCIPNSVAAELPLI